VAKLVAATRLSYFGVGMVDVNGSMSAQIVFNESSRLSMMESQIMISVEIHEACLSLGIMVVKTATEVIEDELEVGAHGAAGLLDNFHPALTIPRRTTPTILLRQFPRSLRTSLRLGPS
jgi:hypothetical protein